MSLNTNLRKLWKWISGGVKPQRRPSRRLLSLEALEDRVVPAATASFGPSILSRALIVQGTDASDNLVIQRTGTFTTVTNNGQAVPITVAGAPTASVWTASIDTIFVNGLGGDDRIEVDNVQASFSMPRTVGVIVHGGDGKDTIYADRVHTLQLDSHGLPWITATGLPTGNQITVYGEAGNDELYGGAGNDTFYGGTGYDNFFGNGGVDTVYDANAFFDPRSGELTVTGSNNWVEAYNDVMIVTQEAGNIQVAGEEISVYNAAGFYSVSAAGVSSSLVRSITVRTHPSHDDVHTEGDDQVTLQTTLTNTFLDGNNRFIPATVHGERGDDRIDATSWKGSLWAEGDSGNDTIYGTSFNDTIYGDTIDDSGYGADRLYGNDGIDELIGGMGADYLFGGNGNDRLYGHLTDTMADAAHSFFGLWDSANALYGEDGNDYVCGGETDDYLYGGNGNDTLRGRGGNDFLYGEAGNDSLFGGATYVPVYANNYQPPASAYFNTLNGGTGADRLLIWTSDSVTAESVDAVIQFQDIGPQTFTTLDGSTVMYGAGKWTEADIERIDVTLGNLQAATGNTRLLKTASGARLTFQRLGDALSTEAVKHESFNTGGIIRLTGSALALAPGDIHLAAAVYREVGHNWDDLAENLFVPAFRQISDWRQSAVKPTVNHVASTATGDYWWYTGDAFARPAGKTNPFEDYATTFETYMLQKFHGTSNGNSVVAAKQLNIDLLMSYLRLFS